MKTRALAVGVLLAAFLPLVAFAAHPDFTGRWMLVVDKSDFGTASTPTGMTLTCENKGDYLYSVQTTQTPDGEQTTEGKWYLDGKAHRNEKPAPGTSKTWWEDDTLVNEAKADDGKYHEKTELSMNSNGTAMEKISRKTPNGSNTLKLIWRRH